MICSSKNRLNSEIALLKGVLLRIYSEPFDLTQKKESKD